jgi:P-type Cu2+ transporter
MTTALDAGIAAPPAADVPPVDATAYVQSAGEGRRTLHLMVEGVHCGGCVRRIEKAFLADPAVEHARVNLTTRRLVVGWTGGPAIADRLVHAVSALGYRVSPTTRRSS